MNYIVARSAPGVIEPHMLAFGRWALAGLILCFIVRNELWRERRCTLQAAWQYLVLGGLIMLIYAASPVLIALGAVLWLGERFSWRQGLGVTIGMAGVFHVVVKGQWLSLTLVQWTAGDGWIVLAMISWAATSLYLSPLYGGIAAWVVLGESMGWHHVMAASLILPGNYLASRKIQTVLHLPLDHQKQKRSAAK